MTIDRFLGYIRGGKVPFCDRFFRGCTVKTPPSHAFVTRVPYRLTFAGESSSWGGGGAAFLDLKESPSSGASAVVRCYLISFSQWREVLEQENGDCDLRSVLTATEISKLIKDGAGATWTLPLVGAWYRCLLVLGQHNGIPMLTFTCAVEHLESTAFSWPSRAYASSLLAGLIQSGHCGPQDALMYLLGAGEGRGEGCSAVAAATFADDISALAAAAEVWLEGSSDTSSTALACVKEWGKRQDSRS